MCIVSHISDAEHLWAFQTWWGEAIYNSQVIQERLFEENIWDSFFKVYIMTAEKKHFLSVHDPH